MINTNQFLPVALKYFNGISFQLERYSLNIITTPPPPPPPPLNFIKIRIVYDVFNLSQIKTNKCVFHINNLILLNNFW